VEENGLFTMGYIARCSLGGPGEYHNEDLLYKLFGINAELLIDHAWGWEPTTIELVKQYKPEVNCVSSGQVLQCPYDFEKAKLIVREMTDLLVLDLVEKELMTDQVVLTIGYDIENLSNPEIRRKYSGEVTTDYYGRKVPKHAHGTANLGRMTSSTKLITDAVLDLYDRIVNPDLLVRRVTIVANRLTQEAEVADAQAYEQMSLFTDYDALQKEREEEKAAMAKERRLQEAMLAVKKRYGKNAILKGMNLQEGATAMERNNQIGGHRA
jgi:DNA polymerase V